MANITSLEDFRTYIRNDLGGGVVCVEISNEQLDICIADAVDTFTRYMYGEGVYKDYLRFDVSANVSGYSIDDVEDIIDIDLTSCCNINVLFSPLNLITQDQIIASNFNTFGSQFTGGIGYSSTTGLELASWDIAMGYIKDIKNKFCTTYVCDYRQATKQFVITPTPKASGIALITVYRKEKALDLYKHLLVRQYAVALAQMVWGRNIKKYSLTLPGGGTLNGSEIYQDGEKERDRILERIYTEGEPIDIYMG